MPQNRQSTHPPYSPLMVCGTLALLWVPQALVLLFYDVHDLGKHKKPDQKCELVGTFSLITQAALGLLCLLLLIIKRNYEYPIRRTWKVWSFDVLKQLVGAFGVHVFNVFLLILKSQDDALHLLADDDVDDDPCDWYFLSIVLDCTIGVYILYLVFSWLNQFCKKTLGITEIDSGEYGDPPKYRAYFKQLTIYFLALMITKLLVFAIVELFQDQLLWITHNIILLWLNEYPEEVEIFMVMFVIPVVMNCLQLVLIDNIIQNQAGKLTNLIMGGLTGSDDTDSQIDREAQAIYAREEAKRQGRYGSTHDDASP